MQQLILDVIAAIAAMKPLELVERVLARLGAAWAAQGLDPAAFDAAVAKARSDIDAQVAQDEAVEREQLDGPKA